MNELTAKRNERHFNAIVNQAVMKIKEDILELQKVKRTFDHPNAQTAAYLQALLKDYLSADTTPLALVMFGLSEDDFTLTYRHAKAGGIEERPFAQVVVKLHTPEETIIPSSETAYLDMVKDVSTHLAPLHMKMLTPYFVFMSRGAGLFQITEVTCNDTVFQCITQGKETTLTFEVDVEYLNSFDLNDIAFARKPRDVQDTSRS